MKSIASLYHQNIDAMKTAIILMQIACFLGCQNIQKHSEIMNDTVIIETMITKLFVNTDNRHWSGVEHQFASKVNLDYTSMTGQPASEVTPTDITTSWKSVLPGFTSTHHQIGNVVIEVKDEKAHAFCYGTARHYLETEHGNLWTVVGSYDFDLEKKENQWKITAMKFNFKYQDGNSKLIEQAIKNVKSNQ